jgi:hypothetical protein
MYRPFLLVAALVTIAAPCALAQSQINVHGKVQNSDGSPAAGAAVTLTDVSTNTISQAITNKKGAYSIDIMAEPKNHYSIAAKLTDIESVPQAVNPKNPDQTINLMLARSNSGPSNQPASYTSATDVLQDGTPVRLVLEETLSSKDARVGQEVVFNVIDDVIVNGHLLIAHGALAKGTVTEAQAKRRMGKAGKLNVNIDYALMTNGDRAALRAVKDAKGDGRGAAVTTGVVATAIVFFPAAPLFLLMHGKDISIPKGTEVTAFVNGNLRFDPAKFAKATADLTPPQPILRRN